MTDRDRKKMEELGEALCSCCPWTNYGETGSMIHTPNGLVMCEGSHCERAFENYLECHEDDEPEEVNWQDDYQKWVDGGRK